GATLFFAPLALFRGGFDLEAAGSPGSDLDDDIIDLPDRWVSRSLVITDLRATPTRYRLLETLREYGAARLIEFEQVDQTLERQPRHFPAIAAAAGAAVANVPPALDWKD